MESASITFRKDNFIDFQKSSLVRRKEREIKQTCKAELDELLSTFNCKDIWMTENIEYRLLPKARLQAGSSRPIFFRKLENQYEMKIKVRSF